MSRSAVRWLNYTGRVEVDMGKPMGPNALGELLYPVTVEYDADSNATRVGFSFVAPPAEGGS